MAKMPTNAGRPCCQNCSCRTLNAAAKPRPARTEGIQGVVLLPVRRRVNTVGPAEGADPQVHAVRTNRIPPASVAIDSVTEPSGTAPADFRTARRKKIDLADPTKVDRLPPHSVEAEQGVLGCVLLSPNDSLGHCIERFTNGPEVFYDLRHRTIYEALVAMYDRKDPIDLITVQQVLKDRQHLESIGGLPYLAALPNAVPRRPISTTTWKSSARSSSSVK